MSVTKPITEPRSDPANKLNNTARHPRNAPIAARNFRSPRPIASRGMTSSRVTPEICVTQTFLSSDDEIGVVAVFCPRERCRPVELDPFSAKGNLTRFEHDPENHVAERSGQRSANAGGHARICLHQSWNNNAASHTRDCSADCYAVWNNEMLEIDESTDDQERNKNPVRNCNLQREPLPNREEKKRGNEFYCEIAKRNFCLAICASPAEREPTY